jgi:hypothetical protein
MTHPDIEATRILTSGLQRDLALKPPRLDVERT